MYRGYPQGARAAVLGAHSPCKRHIVTLTPTFPTQVTARYLRHFNLISVTPFDDDSLCRIFEAILSWWCKRACFSETLAGQSKSVVKASVAAYRAVQEGLLPTPTKSHYTFNLRDLSKVSTVGLGESWVRYSATGSMRDAREAWGRDDR